MKNLFKMKRHFKKALIIVIITTISTFNQQRALFVFMNFSQRHGREASGPNEVKCRVGVLL